MVSRNRKELAAFLWNASVSVTAETTIARSENGAPLEASESRRKLGHH